MTATPDTFAARLRAARAAAGLTQPELARKAGVSLANLRSIEQGRRPWPSFDTADKLATGLGCSMDVLRPTHTKE